MKNILGLMTLVAICAYQPAALADHAELESLAFRVVGDVSTLLEDAGMVIGIRPTFLQRYAIEHIEIAHRRAHGMEEALNDEGNTDHDDDIRQAHERLQRAVFWARETFDDLFYAFRDHKDYDRLDILLLNIEEMVEEMAAHLP